jgi:hypothetical protein
VCVFYGKTVFILWKDSGYFMERQCVYFMERQCVFYGKTVCIIWKDSVYFILFFILIGNVNFNNTHILCTETLTTGKMLPPGINNPPAVISK